MSQVDVDAVRELHKEAVGRFAAEGMLAWADYFAPDIILQPPEGPVVRGIEVLKEWSANADAGVAVEAKSASNEEYLEAGDCIIETGEYSWRLQPKAGVRLQNPGASTWRSGSDRSMEAGRPRDCWNGNG